MWEDFKKHNKKKLIYSSVGLIIAIAMLIVLVFNAFGFADLLADSSVSAEQIRLYGGLLFALLGVSMVFSMRQACTQSTMNSFEKYAQKTKNPSETMMKLKQTWETGVGAGDTRMDSNYIIMLTAWPWVKVVPLDDAIWAYKTVSRVNFVKSGTILTVCFADRGAEVLSLSEKTIDMCLQQFMENHRNVVVGSTREVQKLYGEKDIAGLKEYARQQRAGLTI